MRQLEYPLYDADGQAWWYEHPVHGRSVDIALLPLSDELVKSMDRPFIINEVAGDDLKTVVSSDVFVVGYPVGLHVAGTPIWKRATIASEPEIDALEKPLILIDTATREGMSGSPVVRTSLGMALMGDDSIGFAPGTRSALVGMYSGRMKADTGLDAQLGYCWKQRAMIEIADAKQRSKTFGSV